jgi:hypothetical protein
MAISEIAPRDAVPMMVRRSTPPVACSAAASKPWSWTRLQLAPVRRKGPRAARHGARRCHLRLLDLGEPQVGPAGVRGAGRSAENIPILEGALTRESVPRIRAQMELSLAASRLIASDASLQRQGIAALAAAGTEGARALLLEARNSTPALADEITAALTALDRTLGIK